jgi:hypothetical protein
MDNKLRNIMVMPLIASPTPLPAITFSHPTDILISDMFKA